MYFWDVFVVVVACRHTHQFITSFIAYLYLSATYFQITYRTNKANLMFIWPNYVCSIFYGYLSLPLSLCLYHPITPPLSLPLPFFPKLNRPSFPRLTFRALLPILPYMAAAFLDWCALNSRDWKNGFFVLLSVIGCNMFPRIHTKKKPARHSLLQMSWSSLTLINNG